MTNVIETYQLQLGTEHNPLQNLSKEKYTDRVWLQQLTTEITIYIERKHTPTSQTTQKWHNNNGANDEIQPNSIGTETNKHT